MSADLDKKRFLHVLVQPLLLPHRLRDPVFSQNGVNANALVRRLVQHVLLLHFLDV